MTATLLVAPATEPISLAQAKAWLRVDASDEDDLIASLISAARGNLEADTRRAFVTQTWRLSCDAWPSTLVQSPFGHGVCSSVSTWSIPLAPVASVTALRVYDASDTPQTVSSAIYRLLDAPDEARLVFTSPPPQPGRAAEGIELDVVLGYGAAADVPQPLRQAVLMLVARWFENRGDADANAANDIRGAIASLVAPFRRLRLA